MVLTPVKKDLSGKNMVDSFFLRADKWGDRTLVRYRLNDVYTPISWKVLARRVENTAQYLISAGVKKGDRVGIFASNCWEWWVADLAVLSAGAVSVPVYATNSAEETRYVLDHSGSIVCFVGDDDQLKKVLSVKKKLPAVKKIIHFGNHAKNGVIPLAHAMALGEKSKKGKELARRIKAIKGKDLASIVYTSGTTGNPKGVMLTHDNFFTDVVQLADVFGEYIGVNDTFLSFLPLSHALERTASFYTAFYLNAQVAFAENFRTISRDLQEIQPTILISVPRLFEKIHAGVLASIASMNPVKRFILNWALRVGRENIPNLCANQYPTGSLAKKLSFFEKKVLSKLKKELGLTRNTIAVSGGGPLSYSDCEFFLSIGVNLFEGYGLTEAAPVTHANRVGKIKPGTVGPAMFLTDVKLSDEGEVLIKGPQVMKGYYKNRAATKDSFDKKGYLRTGDLGIIDEDGCLTITGRIKDIIVTSGGKNISPQNIESMILTSKYIENVAIIGDRRKFLSALIIPNFIELERHMKKQGVFVEDREALIKHTDVLSFYYDELESLLSNFARVEQVKRFTLLNDAWGIETGELTPTLKVKRRIIEKKYADVIEEMYAE